MRINILDENNKNILDSVYDYSNNMIAANSTYNRSSDNINFDTGIYNLKLPGVLWDYKNNEFHQRHVIRFEFEKKKRFKNWFKNPYKSLLITDIDLAMKRNKHFKFDEL